VPSGSCLFLRIWLTARGVQVGERPAYSFARPLLNGMGVRSLADLQPDDIFLDVACGTGVFLRRHAAHVQRVAGMDIPDAVIKRMAGVPKKDAGREGISICLETIAALREIPGVRGIHIMAIEWEEKVAEIVEAAGLLPRPAAD